MEYIFILYFSAGILQDFLFTSSLRLVNKNLAFKASSMAFLDNLVSVGVLYSILTKLDNERSIIAIIIYSLGVGTGSYFAMKLKIFEK